MHNTLKRRRGDGGIVTSLFKGCSFTVVVSASLVLIYSVCGGGGSVTTMPYRLLERAGAAGRTPTGETDEGSRKREQ